MWNRRLIWMCLVIFTIVWAAGPAGANLIKNGSFENPVSDPGQTRDTELGTLWFAAGAWGAEDVDDWNRTERIWHVTDGGAGMMPDGSFAEVLDASFEHGGIDVLSQDGLNLTAGMPYELSFYTWGESGNPRIDVDLSGADDISLLDDYETDWTDGVAELVAVKFVPHVTGEYTIEFRGDRYEGANVHYHAWIDDVRLVIKLPIATGPTPAHEATDVPRDVILSWSPGGPSIAKHDVYFGTSFADVNQASRDNPLGVLISEGQDANTIDVGVLAFNQTYYWRIDEVNKAPDNTILKGEIWNFTVEPLGYPIENVVATSNGAPQSDGYPENVVNASGLNENDEHSVDSADMWLAKPVGDEPLTISFEFDAVYKLHEMLVWNYNVAVELLLGFGVKDVTIEYSENGADWATLGDAVFNQGTTKPDYTANTTVDLGGVAAQYVRITVNGAYGALGQYGLSEVRFLYIPVQAREPQPGDGAVDIAPNTDLSWRAGREAVAHEVYLSTDPNALELIETTSTTTVDPGALDLGATYYWKIDEVNDAEAISTWAGAVWSFSTEPYIIVEDFESYTDDIDAGEAIFLNWIDGYEINDNGSMVGHIEAPFAETTIVHGGSQSMPLFFDNSGGVTVSETERNLDIPMDWTAHGIKSLSVAFAGDADNVPGQLYVKVNGTKVVYGGAADDLKVSGWLAWTIDIAALGNVSNVTTLAVGVEGAGASGVVYIDDIRLYPQEGEMVEPAEPDPAGLMAHYTFDSDFQDSSGNGNHAQVVGDAAITNDPARGGIASLDGLGDAILVPAIGDGTASEVTISLWMNTDIAWTSGYFSLFHCDGWAAGDIHMHVSSPGYFTAGVNGMGDNLQSATMPEVDQWYNVTVVVSASEASLYVNGIQEDSRIPTAVPETFIFGEGHLGIWLNGANLERALTGQIDDVRFYNRALSYGEAMGLAGRTTALYKPF